MSRQQEKRSPVAVICSALGTILLILLIVACIPFTVPRAFGYQPYTVVSGSMEPAIPTGSLVYIHQGEAAQDIVEDDIIAFYGGRDASSIITHRVVINRVIVGEFVTKGDANEGEDINPVPYDQYIGKITMHIPKLGALAQTFTSTSGRILAVTLIGIAILLQVIASLISGRRE